MASTALPTAQLNGVNGVDESTPLSPTSRINGSGPPGGVLTFSFLGSQCYAATSYPHPVPHWDEATVQETRDIALSTNLPPSLLEHIQNLIGSGQAASKPNSVYSFTLKPGCYIMHITCWRPESEEDHGRHGQALVPFDMDERALWLVYSWARAPSAQWQKGRDPSYSVPTAEGSRLTHPLLGAYLQDMQDSALPRGNISHVALGQTSDSFFIRESDNLRNWHYRFAGLPLDCELAVQKSMAASWMPKPWECSQGLHHFTFGRPRAVTLGQHGGWILCREESAAQHANALWGGYLTDELVQALKDGRENKLTVNQAVLNPHHALEYVLAFNDGSVYYSFHHSFEKDFERIATQWAAAKGVKFKGKFIPLDDGDYPPPPPPPEVLEQLRRWPPGQPPRVSSSSRTNSHPRPHYNDRPVPRQRWATGEERSLDSRRCYHCHHPTGPAYVHQYSELSADRGPYMMQGDERQSPEGTRGRLQRRTSNPDLFDGSKEDGGRRKERRSVLGMIFRSHSGRRSGT